MFESLINQQRFKESNGLSMAGIALKMRPIGLILVLKSGTILPVLVLKTLTIVNILTAGIALKMFGISNVLMITTTGSKSKKPP